MRVLALRHHASYRCRHSGACCTSGWPIPVEAPLALELQDALAAGTLRLDTDEALAREPLDTPGGLPADVAGLTRSDAAGACAFYERRSGLCAIHHHLGAGRLPSSCAHFPRVCLIDEDATYVTLSHYCPTVAESTVEGRASGVEGNDTLTVEGRGSSIDSGILTEAPALLQGLAVEGLDARGELPPLLRPGLLADRPSYRGWERFVVQELAEGGGTVEERLARVVELTDRVCAWTPSTARSLEQHVNRCVDGLWRERAERREGGAGARLGSGLNFAALYERVRRACPPALAPPPAPEDLAALLARWVDPEWPAWSAVVGRYLAAKVFGSWLAYQGRGFRTVLTGAFAALAVLRVEAARQCATGRPLDRARLKEAVRRADLLLLHLASRERLAERLDDVSTSRT